MFRSPTQRRRAVLLQELFADVRRQNDEREEERQEPVGNVLFFCVAGQNRSAALAAATLLLHGKPLEEILRHCARQRPFVLENTGFQRQLVELEAIVHQLQGCLSPSSPPPLGFRSHWDLLRQARSSSSRPPAKRARVEGDLPAGATVEIELLIPGLCTMEVRIPRECSIPTLKRHLICYVNENLLRHDERPARVAKAWLVLAMFGYNNDYDIPLEAEAVDVKVQLERMEHMFGLIATLKGGCGARLPWWTGSTRGRSAPTQLTVPSHLRRRVCSATLIPLLWF